MVHEDVHIPDTDHGSYGWSWQVMMEHCGKDGVKHEVIQCNLFLFAQKDVEEWQELFGAVVGMQNDGNAIVLGDGAHVHGQSDGTGGGGVLVLDGFANVKGAAAVGDLNDDRGLGLAGGFQDGVASRRTRAVHSWNSISFGTGVLEESQHIVASDYSRGNQVIQRSHVVLYCIVLYCLFACLLSFFLSFFNL
jgi:hypothetical protein